MSKDRDDAINNGEDYFQAACSAKGNESGNCPVCGTPYRHADHSYEICIKCGWEDDPVQYDHPDLDLGANHRSLNESRRIWRETGKHLWRKI